MGPTMKADWRLNHQRRIDICAIPTDNIERGVRHKNKDRTDNRLENIEWIVRKDQQEQANDYILNGVIIERIQQVHRACQRKGIRVPDSYQFTNMMINNALDEYIIRYGLRKVMLWVVLRQSHPKNENHL